jgi:glycosyltransferase involved in cell wall biosynthesis
MKFCIITSFVGHNDGQGRVNLEIAAEAVRQGHEVVLLTEGVGKLPPDLSRNAIVLPPPSWLPGRLLRDQVFAWRSWMALARIRAGCDAVLANGFNTWARSDVNAVHFVHSTWLRSPHHPWRVRRTGRTFYARVYSGLNTILERFAFARAGRLVAVSSSVADDLQHCAGGSAPVSVILNGVDIVEFHPGPSDRRALGLPDSVPLALFAGDLKSPRKNLDTVLRAMPTVPELHLAVAGREARTPYPHLAQTLGISDRVHFLGFRRDMPALLRAVDLFVFPSRYEACTLVLLEALASGVPVVTARCTGGSELVDPSVGVVLEDCDDSNALAAALRALVMDDRGRQAMARNARALAERHTWGDVARHYIDLLVLTAHERAISEYV